MARSPSWCGVILAAGESTRMGRDKALLPWPPALAGSPPTGQTFLSAAIRALSPVTELVMVVAGKNEAALAAFVYTTAAVLVTNPDPDRGQFSSLQVGLREVLNRGRDAAIITLVDRPPVTAGIIENLREAFENAPSEKWSVIPEYGGKHGHPIFIGREMIEVFLRAPATATARDLEHENREHIEYVPVNDPLVVINVNTPEDYQALLSLPTPLDYQGSSKA
jgi:molybdenum cofactor cytidylyltransferase